MKKKSVQYSCNPYGGGFKVAKFVDEECETEYTVLNDGKETYCDCLGFSNKGSCRHITITSFFLKEDRVGKGYLLDFDRGTFIKILGEEV